VSTGILQIAVHDGLFLFAIFAHRSDSDPPTLLLWMLALCITVRIGLLSPNPNMEYGVELSALRKCVRTRWKAEFAKGQLEARGCGNHFV
jgi:hypothetical protein